jgi:hypothetical protein
VVFASDGSPAECYLTKSLIYFNGMYNRQILPSPFEFAAASVLVLDRSRNSLHAEACPLRLRSNHRGGGFLDGLPDLKASQTSRFGIENGFACVTRLLPSPVGRRRRRNATAPSVQRHYSAFVPTTGCSAPVRIGTQSLAGITHSAVSLGIGTTGSPIPHESLIPGHAAFEPDAAQAGLQGSACTRPGMTTNPGFDVDDTISAVHRRFALARFLGSHLTGSSSRRFRDAHHHRP